MIRKWQINCFGETIVSITNVASNKDHSWKTLNYLVAHPVSRRECGKTFTVIPSRASDPRDETMRASRFYCTTFPPFRSIYLIVKPNAPYIIQIFLPLANIVRTIFFFFFFFFPTHELAFLLCKIRFTFREQFLSLRRDVNIRKTGFARENINFFQTNI